MATKVGETFAEAFIRLSAKVRSEHRDGPATQWEIAWLLGVQPLQVSRWRKGVCAARNPETVLGALRAKAREQRAARAAARAVKAGAV